MTDHIGATLKRIRCHRGITEEQLAVLLSEDAGETITPDYVAKVEQGLVSVSWERLALFSKSLRCQPSQVTKLAELTAEGRSEAEVEAMLPP